MARQERLKTLMVNRDADSEACSAAAATRRDKTGDRRRALSEAGEPGPFTQMFNIACRADRALR